MNERYDIDKFYVGELVLSENACNLVRNIHCPEEKAKRDLKEVTVNNGAISLGDSIVIPEINKTQGLLIHTYITMYHKTMNGYLCLHNGIVYTMDQNDKCDNLVKLTSLLPKVDYEMPKEVSHKDALQLFDILMGNKIDAEVLGGNEQHEISNYYYGRLCLCDGLEVDSYMPYSTNNYIELNSTLSRITKANGAIMSGFNAATDSKVMNGVYSYALYNGIFIKKDSSYIFIHNNQSYDNVSFISNARPSILGESYCDKLVPLKEKLKQQGRTKVMSLSINEGKKIVKEMA